MADKLAGQEKMLLKMDAGQVRARDA